MDPMLLMTCHEKSKTARLRLRKKLQENLAAIPPAGALLGESSLRIVKAFLEFRLPHHSRTLILRFLGSSLAALQQRVVVGPTKAKVNQNHGQSSGSLLRC